MSVSKSTECKNARRTTLRPPYYSLMGTRLSTPDLYCFFLLQKGPPTCLVRTGDLKIFSNYSLALLPTELRSAYDVCILVSNYNVLVN
jgi:hypothetical protein